MKFIDFVKEYYPNIELTPYHETLIKLIIDNKLDVNAIKTTITKEDRIKDLDRIIKEGGIKHGTINTISTWGQNGKSVFKDRYLSDRNKKTHNWCIIDDPIKEVEDDKVDTLKYIPDMVIHLQKKDNGFRQIKIVKERISSSLSVSKHLLENEKEGVNKK